eukprot:9262556-Ditylum_brightwellii.AAC.1
MRATLSARCTGLSQVVVFTDAINLDAILAYHAIVTLICGGIFKDKNQDKTPIIPWSSVDPDSKINFFLGPKITANGRFQELNICPELK